MFVVFLVIVGLICYQKKTNKTVDPFSNHSENDSSDDDGNDINLGRNMWVETNKSPTLLLSQKL